jgi:crotonobetaine/carnitine-CoA ligase
LPLFHSNAINVGYAAAVRYGSTIAIGRRFSASRFWDDVIKYKATCFNYIGEICRYLYNQPPKPTDRKHRVKKIVGNGLRNDMWIGFKKKFGIKQIFEFYGAAEGGMTFNTPGDGPVGSIGKPASTQEALIVDENDQPCPPGVQGEIVFRNADGSCPAVEYFKNPDASVKKTRDGWLRMGDIGHTDEQGWFYFDYRMGGGIRRNGDFVNVGFVEKVVAEYPQVDDVFVYGVDIVSGAPGEKDVVAAVVPSNGGLLDTEDLFRHCREQLEANFVPTYIQVLEEIPKTASEKPQERFCLELFRDHPETVITQQN